MTNNIFKSLCAVFLVLSLSACGAKVEVPPAHVAKVMGTQGYDEGLLPTSKFRLDPCWAYCDKLVVLNVADVPVTEKMSLLMPKDKLNMSFDLRLTIAVNPKRYEELFDKIPPSDDESDNTDRIFKIQLGTAYNTYAQQIIRAEAREYLSNFTIAEVISSRETINNELSERLTKSISEKTPFIVRYAGLADINYPEIIVKAQENAATRREQIAQEEAQLEISKVQLERELQEARLQRSIDVEKAEAESEVNKILASSVTKEYVKYRELNALEKISGTDNKVFVPVSMLDSMAGQYQLGKQ